MTHAEGKESLSEDEREESAGRVATLDEPEIRNRASQSGLKKTELRWSTQDG